MKKNVSVRDREIINRWYKCKTVVEIERGNGGMVAQDVLDHIMRDYLSRRDAEIEVSQ